MKAGLYKVTYILKCVQDVEIGQDEIDEMGEDSIEYAVEEDGFDASEYEVVDIIRYQYVG